MRFRAASRETNAEFDRLRADGLVSAGLALGMEGEANAPVAVRALAEDDPVEWATPLNGALDVRAGVIAFSGADTSLAGQLAVEFAAWCGDRGQAVTVVDACVEEPVLERALPDDPDEGLVDAVLYGVSPQRVLRRTLTPNVSVVNAGSHPVSVDGVFKDENFERALRSFSGEGLVLLVVPSAHLGSASHALDAAVCVAEGERDLLSLPSVLEGKRCVSVLVGEPASEEELRAVREGELRIVEPSASESSERPVEHREEPQVTREPVVMGAYSTAHSRRGGAGRVALVVLIVAVAALWWGLDGRHRLTTSREQLAGRAIEGPAVTGDQGEPTGEPGTVTEPAAVPATAAEQDEDQTGEEDAPGGEGTVPVGAGEEPSPARTPGEEALDRTADGEEAAGRVFGPGGRYRVMVSSHRREGDARIEAAQVSRQGVETEVVATDVADRGVWYRVVVAGGYPSHSMALEVLDTVKSLGYEGAWIERAAANQ